MAEEEKLATDERVWRAAEEHAHKDSEAMEKRVREDLEFEASNNQMKLDQEEGLHVDTLVMREEGFQAHCDDEIALSIQKEEQMLDAYKDDRILPNSLDELRFNVPDSILHHPFTAHLLSSQYVH